jgi:hypothetical protein
MIGQELLCIGTSAKFQLFHVSFTTLRLHELKFSIAQHRPAATRFELTPGFENGVQRLAACLRLAPSKISR